MQSEGSVILLLIVVSDPYCNSSIDNASDMTIPLRCVALGLNIL